MKKILTLAICLIVLLGGAKASEKFIDKKSLPKKAMEIIERYFPNERISYIKLDKSLFNKNYDVVFTSGTNIDFDKSGEWKKIDSYKNSIPSDLIPKQILDYVEENESNAKVMEIEKTDEDGYEIKLENKKEIEFNEMFKVIDIDY